jgi:putative (di)nucleoside polyphosphate hydrolase
MDARVEPGHDEVMFFRMSPLKMDYDDLPYRPCVGVMVLNRVGLALIGRRIGGPEHVDLTHSWQMPPGGIDSGEDPWPAALRELREETNICSVERLGEMPEWLNYDIPRDIVGLGWKGRYRGQTQKWYALRFTGDESEIDVAHPAGGIEPEFAAWRWEPMRNIPDLVVPFKRAVYERVVAEFVKFAAPANL